MACGRGYNSTIERLARFGERTLASLDPLLIEFRCCPFRPLKRSASEDERTSPMGNKIFVGNISFDTTE
jgi:hypothetical protein